MLRTAKFFSADRCVAWFRPVCPGVHQGAAAVRCPYCRHDETKVIDSRTSQDLSIRRRRECLSCERRFTTYERIEESPIRVIKKDGTRVPFDREKIRFGVEKACYKRPVSPEQIDGLVGSVEATVYEDGEREVSSRRIGELVFNALRDLDKVAFVRFASVYREFQDVNDFVEELQPILDGRRRDSLH
jgi:transcriptional repressor NrdR